MEPKIPEWITADFLKQSLESDERYRGIEIIDFKSSLAAPAGNNYGGLVVRITIDCKLRGDKQNVSIIVKAPLTEGELSEFMSQVTNTEPSFYSVFLPEANKLLEIQFAPNTFHSPIPAVVVMEDLKESGYVMADRIKRLDFKHCLLYTKAAAAFHAVSMALYRQNPEMIDSIWGVNYYSDGCVIRNILVNMNKWSLGCMANNISDKRISGIVRNSIEHMWHMIVDVHRSSNNDFNALLQYDPWTTNMMFKYDSQGNVCDIKLIDFQNVFYSSPVHDVVLFIWYSANDDVRKHHMSALYSNYLKELNRNLRAYKCPEIDSEVFMATIKKFSPFALAVAAASATLLNPAPADFVEIITKGKASDASVETNPMERYFTEDFCQTVLPQMVDTLAEEGVFDYLEDKIKSLSDISS